MEEDSRRRLPAWTAAFRIGSRSFPATLLLTTLAAAASVWISGLGVLQFALGKGWGIPFLVTLLMFGVMLAFRNIMFRSLYEKSPSDVDAALIQYLTNQGPAQNNGEEEMTADLLENALHLKEIRAYDCMAPRAEIVHIDINQSVETLRQLFMESKLSRIIVSDGDLDRVKGYVHVQQMFEQPAGIREIVMPITFVPETIPVSDILNKFIRNRTSIACVVDEYGSLAGLVTLEDALEQLFGEIDDEHDQEEFIEAALSPEEFIFSGRLEVAYLNRKYPALHIPEGDYTTLSGYIVALAQTIPEQGARITDGNNTFVLELVSDRKIETVRVLIN